MAWKYRNAGFRSIFWGKNRCWIIFCLVAFYLLADTPGATFLSQPCQVQDNFGFLGIDRQCAHLGIAQLYFLGGIQWVGFFTQLGLFIRCAVPPFQRPEDIEDFRCGHDQYRPD